MSDEITTEVSDSELLPPGYLTLAATIRRLRKSDSTIERLVRSEALHSELVPRRGRKPERVYRESDVEHILAQEEKRKALRPPSALPPAKLPLQLLPPEVENQLVPMLRAVHSRMTAPPPVRLTEKLWLTLKEASELSGLSREELLLLCRDEKVRSRRAGSGRNARWRILRKSLEAFEG